MNEGEFQLSPIGAATHDWLAYTVRVIEFNDVVYRGIRTLGPTAMIATFIGSLIRKINDEQRAGADKAIALAKREVDTDFEFAHALILVAAWGAFEAFIEDICKAMLVMHPELLAEKPFESVKVPASVLVSDSAEQVDVIFDEATKRLGSALKVGVGKFESQLKLVGLDSKGDISSALRDAIVYAQQTRNVWAHKFGKADKGFIERCPDKGFSLGDTVKISTEQNSIHLHALLVYGVLIVNRFRASRQMTPTPWPGGPGAPFSDPYEKQWGSPPEPAQSATPGWTTQPPA